MKKATCCDAISESPQKEPGRLAPMQNSALLKLSTEEGFLLSDTTFEIIAFNRSFQKLRINFEKNICEDYLILTKVPARRLVIPENNLLKAVSGKKAEKEIELPSGEKEIPGCYKKKFGLFCNKSCGPEQFYQICKIN